MVYCTQCGTAVDGRFCPQCGADTAPQAAAPVPQPAVPAAPAAPAAVNTRSPWVWVLAGCLGLVVIAGVIAVAAGLFVVNKAREAGLDPDLMKRNPGLAATRLLAAMNPDLDVVSVDEDKGIVTVREKSTGKTVTMNFEDIRNGKVVFTDERGEQVDIQARGEAGGEGGSFTVKSKEGIVKGGSQWTLPDWLPVYSGARIQSGANSSTPEEEAGAGYLLTGDSIETVLKFYEEALRNDGFEVSRRVTAADGKNSLGTITGQSDEGNRHVNVVVTAGDGGTRIHLSYSAKK